MSNLANVTILARAWSDLRFVRLARFLGLSDATVALARCARLWAYQTTLFSWDAPTYAVNADTIEDAIGVPGAADALVRADLAEAMPDAEGQTVYRVKGTKGMIEWLDKLRSAAPLGAAARRKREDTRPPAGVPDGEPAGTDTAIGIEHHNHHPAGMPAGVPAGPPAGEPIGGPSLLLEDPRSDLSSGSDPSRARKRKRPATSLPEGWLPRPEDNVLGSPQLEHEFARFRDHAAAKDWRMVDWNATWRNWQRTALDRAPRGFRAQPQRSVFDALRDSRDEEPERGVAS